MPHNDELRQAYISKWHFGEVPFWDYHTYPLCSTCKVPSWVLQSCYAYLAMHAGKPRPSPAQFECLEAAQIGFLRV